MNDAITETRKKISKIGRLLFERNLTDVAGGNISARVGDVVCLTPRYCGSRLHWQLQPEQVLVVNLDGEILEGDGEISREAKVHLALHREFTGYGKAVVHAHARNILVFAAMSQPMPGVLEGTLKFGEVPICRYAPSSTDDLADFVVEAMRGQTEKITRQAAGVIAPWHGLFVMGLDLDAAFDAVERLDNNAYVILMAQMLGGTGTLAAQRAALNEGIAPYKGSAE